VYSTCWWCLQGQSPTCEPASVLVTSAKLRPVSLSTLVLPPAAKHMACAEHGKPFISQGLIAAGCMGQQQQSGPPLASCSCHNH
jgi:hypothetical protein